MPQRIYNSFYPGIKQDNYLTGSGSFIDAKNMDGLKEGIGITLGPKVNKLIKTDVPIRALQFAQLSSENFDNSLFGGDNGEIYKGNSTDNTPEFTASGDIRQVILFNNNYYLFILNGSLLLDIYKISVADVLSNNWTGLTITSATNLSHSSCPPYLTIGSEIFIGLTSSIVKFDGTNITDTYTFPDSIVMSLTLQGSTISVYCKSGNTYLWDGGSTIESARGYVGSRINKAVNLNGLDYQTTEDGQLKKGLYNQFVRLYKPNISFRLEDNTQLQTKLDFGIDEPNGITNNTIITAIDDLYIYSKDSVKGIYKYGNILPGTQKGLHKIICQNHEGTDIDYIYDMFFYERVERKLYFSYKAGTTYGVDYIDLDFLETCTSGYLVSEIFTGGTEFLKQLNVIRVSVSNIDVNNTVKLYYRVNNQEWVLIRDINSLTEDIYNRQNIYNESDTSAFKEFIDYQLKIEFIGEGTNKPPTLNEIMTDYTITKS